jgi:hypothetical protein
MSTQKAGVTLNDLLQVHGKAREGNWQQLFI